MGKDTAEVKRRGRPPGKLAQSKAESAAGSKRCPHVPATLPRAKKSSGAAKKPRGAFCDDDMSPARTEKVEILQMPAENAQDHKAMDAPKEVPSRRLSEISEL